EMQESIVNKTPLSKTTNIKLSGNAPSVYRKAIARDSHAADELVDQVISGHLIEPDLLWGDDFYAFFRAGEKRCALWWRAHSGSPSLVTSTRRTWRALRPDCW